MAEKAKGTALVGRAYDTGEESSLEQYTNEVEDIISRAVQELGLPEVQADPEDGTSGVSGELRPVLPPPGSEVHDVDDTFAVMPAKRRSIWRRGGGA